MLSGRPVKEKEEIQKVLLAQQAQTAAFRKQEHQAVNEVAERERQFLSRISKLQTQLQETKDEVARSHQESVDLQKALRLAAEKLSSANASEAAARAEAEETRSRMSDMHMEIQTLRARLYGEKGVRLDALAGGGAAPRAAPGSAEHHEDDVITSIVTGAVPAARDAAGVTEGRAAASRHAREQLKQLLFFVNSQLKEDLANFRSGGDDEEAINETRDLIGRRRALMTKLETALYDLMGGSGLKPLGGGGGGGGGGGLGLGGPLALGGGGGGGGAGWAPRIQGDSLPRSVAVNELAIRPVLLTSGPAARWVLRPHDSPAPPDAAAAAPTGGEAEEEGLRWVAGESLMMIVEAVDENGSVDTDYDSVVLVETETHVSGRGLVRVTSGVGIVMITSKKAGGIDISLTDGGFSVMEVPPPFAVNFVGGTPAKMAFTPEVPEAVAGDAVPVMVEVHDRFGNRCEIDCEVSLAASHGAEFGDGPIALEAGVATIDLVSTLAATVSLQAVSVTGEMAEDIPEEGFSTVAYVRYVPGGAAVVQLSLPPNAPDPIAGERTKLLVTVADKNGNSVPDSTIAADLKVEAGPIGNASVERSGAASIADGTGEVWVRSETATEPTEFWLSGAAPGGLAIMHTEDEPFVATWTAGKSALLGLFAPET